MFRSVSAAIGSVFLMGLSPVGAADDERIQQAVDVVKSLCITGEQVDIQADGKGNVTFRRLKPGVSGDFSLSFKKADGAVMLRDELRRIGDADIRECTSKYIDRIIDAVLGAPSSQDSSAIWEEDEVRVGDGAVARICPEKVGVHVSLVWDSSTRTNTKVKLMPQNNPGQSFEMPPAPRVKLNQNCSIEAAVPYQVSRSEWGAKLTVAYRK